MHSSAFGHLHRGEHAFRTTETRQGPLTVEAMSVGYLGRGTIGAMPGHPGQPNWATAFGTGMVDMETGEVSMSLHRINKGECLFDGKIWTGIDDKEWEAEVCGMPQIARASVTYNGSEDELMDKWLV